MAAVTDEAIEYVYPEIDFGTAEVPDLEALMTRLQEEGKRVVRIRYIGQPAWLILRHKELYDAFMDGLIGLIVDTADRTADGRRNLMNAKKAVAAATSRR